MATKKTKNTEESLDLPGNEAELDEAIDGLRGVLKQDASGEASGFGGDFGSESFGEDALGDSTFGGGIEESSSLPAFGDGFGSDDFGSSSNDSSFDSSFSTSATAGSALNANLDLIMDIPIDVQIVLGSSRMQVSGLMNLTEGAIIALDRKIGEPVEITVNGRKIARGEITVLENDDTRFGVKLIEVMSTKKA
jgi:flagellar motor switch protein FliN/FliY